MRFLLIILVFSFALLQLSLAASLSSSKSSKRTTNDQGYIFSNVYNSGMSSGQRLEILRRMKTVEEKLEKIQSNGLLKVGTTVRCAPGWKEFNGSCYFAFIKPTATWSDARDVCKSLGADLIKITSAAENTFAYGLISADLASLTHVWIGLHRGGDGTFYWVDGSSIGLGYSHWDTGEPGSSEKCGVFYSGQSVPSGWHDTDCNNSWGYICKMAKLK